MSQRNTIWMYPNRIYICSGGASANSLFFEDRYCHKLFFKYLNRFVSPMANILQYKLNATEWALLIQTKSEEEIRAAYFAQREKSDTANREKDHNETFRMISEHFRMLLSNFAKASNYYLGRKGVVVMKRFDKYPISSEVSYSEEFDRICDLKFCSYQQIKKKYSPDETFYDKDKLMEDNDKNPSVMRSALAYYRGLIRLEMMPIRLVKVKPKSNVLREMLYPPQKQKFNKKPPP